MKDSLLLTATTRIAAFVPVPRAPAPRVTRRWPGDSCATMGYTEGEGPRAYGTHIFYNGQQAYLT